MRALSNSSEITSRLCRRISKYKVRRAKYEVRKMHRGAGFFRTSYFALRTLHFLYSTRNREIISLGLLNASRSDPMPGVLVGQEPLICLPNAVGQSNARPPAERVDSAGIEQ